MTNPVVSTRAIQREENGEQIRDWEPIYATDVDCPGPMRCTSGRDSKFQHEFVFARADGLKLRASMLGIHALLISLNPSNARRTLDLSDAEFERLVMREADALGRRLFESFAHGNPSGAVLL